MKITSNKIGNHNQTISHHDYSLLSLCMQPFNIQKHSGVNFLNESR